MTNIFSRSVEISLVSTFHCIQVNDNFRESFKHFMHTRLTNTVKHLPYDECLKNCENYTNKCLNFRIYTGNQYL